MTQGQPETGQLASTWQYRLCPTGISQLNHIPSLCDTEVTKETLAGATQKEERQDVELNMKLREPKSTSEFRN